MAPSMRVPPAGQKPVAVRAGKPTRNAAKDKDMHQYDDHHLLPPTGIDIPPEIRLYVITLLQYTLACTVDLRSQVKQAGWNVKGPLHALFATMATALEAYTDLVAERLVVLGGVACGTTRTAALQSMLSEYPGVPLEGPAHVRALVERFTAYATAIRGDITHTADVEDAGSAALYTDLSRGVDQLLGGVEAYLHR
jgi:starvation-inducible DNA-binding protein